MSAKKPAPDHRTLAVSVTDFARSLNMSENTVYRMIYRGELKAARLGRVFRIPVTEYGRLGLPVPKWTQRKR